MPYLTSNEIRERFLDYFRRKDHAVVESAPMVLKDDPTLMFTNAGMNQFKDYFLGNSVPQSRRVADTQKCLRVSGKHNDLEEVGIDSYHHTMFEMLGNWSFGDYFKKEAIAWGWELLTREFGLPEDRLYVTVFGGDEGDGLEPDNEAAKLWSQWVPGERILRYGKTDNFWEMGDTGPCGPCSEIHIDLRDDADRAKVSGAELVNADDPQVIELWNLVFIQFNRRADGVLEQLPEKHVDTGMGFERLCMVVQGKKSNYDSDVFTPLIEFIEKATGISYTGDYTGHKRSDVAMRVVADHSRALFFGIADGQLPSNTGAGYVLRRILRRAVRYAFSFLGMKEPFIYSLVPWLAEYYDGVFEGVSEQRKFVAQVIEEEERSFLRTLAAGLKRFDDLEVRDGKISGKDAFVLYDTYGFPIDLTRLMASEKGLQVDDAEFERHLQQQKDKSRADAERTVGDWIVLEEGTPGFVGYEDLTCENVRVLRYRKVESKGKTQYQLVLNPSPFYPQGGGQIGDTGVLVSARGSQTRVVDSLKENELLIVVSDELPEDLDTPFRAIVDARKRRLTENNHTSTHLLHAALREVLGDHVQQRGSLVTDTYLRFDFSHFQKMTDVEIREVEKIVNAKIRENIRRGEKRDIPIEEAIDAGAMMLFGEKYGDSVRMITFDPDFSVELCGGCHVHSTGQIGIFKIVSESAIAAGVRRIEALTSIAAEEYIEQQLDELREVRELFKNPKDLVQSASSLFDENKSLKKQLEELRRSEVASVKSDLLSELEDLGGVRFGGKVLENADSKAVKDLVFQVIDQLDDVFVVIAVLADGKVQLHVGISKQLVNARGLHAGNIVKDLSRLIKGGGGGQPHYASAGGKDASGVTTVMDEARRIAEGQKV